MSERNENLVEEMRKILDKMDETEADAFQINESEKADKDYDDDGKVESEKDEYWGSRMKAAKEEGNLEEAELEEEDELEEEADDLEEEVDPKAWWRTQLDELYKSYEELAEDEDLEEVEESDELEEEDELEESDELEEEDELEEDLTSQSADHRNPEKH